MIVTRRLCKRTFSASSLHFPFDKALFHLIFLYCFCRQGAGAQNSCAKICRDSRSCFAFYFEEEWSGKCVCKFLDHPKCIIFIHLICTQKKEQSILIDNFERINILEYFNVYFIFCANKRMKKTKEQFNNDSFRF